MSKLQPTLYLSFEVTKVLAGMERDGIKIDRQALNLVKDEYTKELEELDLFLNKEVTRVMGICLLTYLVLMIGLSFYFLGR